MQKVLIFHILKWMFMFIIKNRVMNKLVLSVVIVICGLSSIAQLDPTTESLLTNRKAKNTSDTTWQLGGVVNLNFSQVHLVNWAGGGQNSISTRGLVSLFANYSNKKMSWDNSLDLTYGIVKQGNARSTPWFKNDDRIEMNSKFGHLASKKWYYSGLLNFRTQFTKGYNAVGDTVYISRFMAPGYSIVALGMDYKPSKNFSMFISPITSKITFVLDDYLSSISAFGVDSGQVFRSEIGGYFKLGLTKQKPLKMEGVTFKTNVTLFTNYKDHPENIDVTWETLTDIKLNKYLTMNISTYLIYDNDIKIGRYNDDGSPTYMKNANGENYVAKDGNFIQSKGPATQFKEAWSVGFAYKF